MKVTVIDPITNKPKSFRARYKGYTPVCAYLPLDCVEFRTYLGVRIQIPVCYLSKETRKKIGRLY